jgi:hypothetical protein
VQPDEKVQKLLHRFEPVEWLYDGLNGKIIKWTLENGGTSHDPSILAFVVGRDGEVFSSLMKGKQYAASSFAKWMEEQADAYEKLHPATRLPFQRAKVVARGEGTDRAHHCAALDEARAEKPVLLYFGRDRFKEGDKTGKKENKLSRSFVKKTLNSKSAEKESKGWAMLRFDLADESHAAFAKTLGVEAAPALLMWLPGKDEPEALRKGISGQSLAVILKKHRPEQTED